MALADTYPEAKRAAITAVGEISRVTPDIVHIYLADLTQGLVSNLAHQHVTLSIFRQHYVNSKTTGKD